MPKFSDSIVLDNDIYFLDLKRGKGENKEKTRLEVTLEEATKIASELYPFSEIPLRPYTLVEYFRQHYIPKNMENTRLTLDNDLRYFFFPLNKREAVETGREDNYTILEIKEEKPDKNFNDLMMEMLREVNAFPIISKKFMAYNLLGLYHIKTSGKPLYKELKDYELESKLEVDIEECFQRIKQFFEEGNSDFKLPSHFPYTIESASINRYYRNDQGLFKAMLRRSEAEIVRKGNIEVVKDELGLDCIIKRKETKGNIVPIDSQMMASAQLQGELLRMRKAFWVNNPQTLRSYHISLDCCLGLPGMLHEVEVEYVGRHIDSETNEEEIIMDVTNLTSLLIEKFPELKPSRLTKQDWLGIK